MRIHAAKTASSCFCALRRSIRRTVSKHVLLTLVVAMVLVRLDYGSATLAGLPDLLLGKLQSVLNAAACRLVFSGRKYDHVTPLLCDLHGCLFRSSSSFVWLCLPIGANMVWHRLICQLIFTTSWMLTPVGDFDPHRWQRCSFHARDSRRLVTELSQLPRHALGTIYHPVSLQRRLTTFRKTQNRTF